MDADNAFNRVSRWQALAQVALHFPYFMPFLGRIYGEDSNGWFFGYNSETTCTGITAIPSLEGVHQGDVMGSWLHCMATLPFIKDLAAIIGDDGFVKFFIDDGNLSGDYKTMGKAIDHVLSAGDAVGYFLKLTKGTYLLGRCTSRLEALRRKAELVIKYKFKQEMIRIHPDNGGDPLLYGAKVLGSFVGSGEYIVAQLDAKLTELTKEAEAITRVSSLQVQYLLLRWCFCQKIIYLQRTTDPYLLDTHLAPRFDDLKRLILSSILGRVDGIPDKTFLLAQLHIQDSGLGLFDSGSTTKAAYAASMIECRAEIQSMKNTCHHESCQLVDPTTVVENGAIACIETFQTIDPSITWDSLQEIAQESKDKPGAPTVQQYLSKLYRPSQRAYVADLFTTPREVAWLESIRDPQAGLWLDFAPKTNMHRMSNEQFRVALTLRLHMPQKAILPGTMCDCRKPGKTAIALDVEGIHLTSGCSKRGTATHNHDRLKDQAVKTIILWP